MFSESAEFYDLIYGQFKDYSTEAARVADILRDLHPKAARILDVGCSTGQHARHLSEEHGFVVDGLDIEPGLLEVAREHNPGGSFFHGDMADFRLDRRYDVVLCLFSSIGYVKTTARLAAAARCFQNHLDPGGVVVIEPWFTPQSFEGGSIYLQTVDREDLKICRVSRSEVRGTVSRIEFRYLVATPDGIRHMSEVHELGLFSEAEMEAALLASGLRLERREEAGLAGGRGLYVARNAT
jgi:SAM-dependent methyltransferase